ncbi:MAG: hypothetical protein AAFR26_01785 [Cyanobacteria bacterium J06626_4]
MTRKSQVYLRLKFHAIAHNFDSWQFPDPDCPSIKHEFRNDESEVF